MIRCVLLIVGFCFLQGRAHFAPVLFAATHQVSTMVQVTAPAGGSASPQRISVDSGATVTFRAQPTNSYSIFHHWSTSSRPFFSCENPLTLVVGSDTNLTAHFVPAHFTEDFSGQAQYEGDWIITDAPRAHGIERVARSAPISGPGVTAMRMILQSRGGRGSFEVRVSSEPIWDKLVFWLNDELHMTWSGDVPWTRHEFDIPPGDVTMEWYYVKDARTDMGLDVAMIDKIQLPPDVTHSFSMVMNGVWPRLMVQADPDECWQIESSSDLRNWTVFVQGRTNADGLLSGTDRSAAGVKARFYRARKL